MSKTKMPIISAKFAFERLAQLEKAKMSKTLTERPMNKSKIRRGEPTPDNINMGLSHGLGWPDKPTSDIKTVYHDGPSEAFKDAARYATEQRGKRKTTSSYTENLAKDRDKLRVEVREMRLQRDAAVAALRQAKRDLETIARDQDLEVDPGFAINRITDAIAAVEKGQ